VKIFSTFYFINIIYPYNARCQIGLTGAGWRKDESCFPFTAPLLWVVFNEKLEGYG
jgi:hypothetical protein